MLKSKTKKAGFTLIELMVSISVFIIVMVISSGSILSVFNANKKSQTLRTVMDNLNFTMEAMTRTIRFGTNYHCDANISPITTPRDCNIANPPADSMAVKSSDNKQTIYKLDNGQIKRSVDGGTFYSVTSSDVTINYLKFRVIGSTPYSVGSDLYQPQVIIVISGFAGIKPTSKSTFSLQTTVSQRMFDSQ